MRKLLLCSIAMIASVLIANAQTDTLMINLKDNQVVKIAISDITKIQFDNVSAVGSQIENENLRVSQNFPNPIKEHTTIEFEIAYPGTVDVLIYDINGTLRQKLECDNCRSGKNTLLWNCLDKNNNRVQSGVYYYEVHFNNETQLKKMIVVK
jgi:flagellar hook assembly protein FlgD